MDRSAAIAAYEAACVGCWDAPTGECVVDAVLLAAVPELVVAITEALEEANFHYVEEIVARALAEAVGAGSSRPG